MKKLIALTLALLMALALAACGGNKTTDTSAPAPENADTQPEASSAGASAEEQTAEPETEEALSKEEMLSAARPLTREEIEKSIDNMAFAKSLTGNIYTFGGTVESVEEEYAVITFYIEDGETSYATTTLVMTAHMYLPAEELVSLEAKQRLLFVGKLDDVSTHDESVPDWGTEKVVDMVFRNAAVTGDRFEKTGKLFSKNAGYGEDAWNVLPPDSNIAFIVHFRDDVSAYKGQTITFSYRITSDGCVDAYIIE